MAAWQAPAAVAVLALASMLSCADVRRPEEPPPATPHAGDVASQVSTIAGLELELAESAAECRIVSLAGETVLAVTPPCRFHRSADGTVRTVTATDGVIALVERSVPDPAAAGDCITTIQAVKVTGGEVRASPHVDTVAMCAPFAWDVQMFTGLWDNP